MKHGEERRKFNERLEKRHEKIHTVLSRPRDVPRCKPSKQTGIQAGIVDDYQEIGEDEMAAREILSQPNRRTITIHQDREGVEPPLTEPKSDCLRQPAASIQISAVS